MALPPNAPTRINGYEITDFLGKGGMGVVYRARQVSIGRDVALKVLTPKLAQDRVFVARLQEEAKAAARLDHPNIVRAITAGEADGYHYFAMEFVDGKSLAQMLSEYGPLDPGPALKITYQIAMALQYAAERNMVHLDLKPSNILLTADRVPKLADLGLARRILEKGSFISEKTMVFGTPRYMSPEHLTRQHGLDGRCDIYSLGVTFYEMLTNMSPFREAKLVDSVKRVKAGVFEPLDKVMPTLSKDLCAVIHKMMARKREDRYRNAQELLADLTALQKDMPPAYALGQAPVTEREAMLAAARKPETRRPALAIALTAGAIVWLGFVALVVGPFARDQALHRFVAPGAPAAAQSERQRQYDAIVACRRVLLVSSAFTARRQYGQAVAEIDAFLSGIAKKSVPDAASLESRAAGQRADILKIASDEIVRLHDEGQQAIRQHNWSEARDLAARLNALGLTEAETEARELVRLAQAAEMAYAKEQSQSSTRRAFADLTAQVERLTRERNYAQALAACDAFLARKEYADFRKGARDLREPLVTKGTFMAALERGATAMIGESVKSLGGDITTVQDSVITLRKENATEKIRASDVAADALVEMAKRGGMSDTALLHVAAASVSIDSEHYGDAYKQVELARQEKYLPYASLLSEIEAQSLFGLAETSARNDQWQDCLDDLAQLAEKQGNSDFYASHASQISDLETGARHEQLLAKGLVYVGAGDFFSHGKEKMFVDAFYIDKREVSVGDYAKFLQALQSLKQSNGQARIEFLHPDEEPNKDHTPVSWAEQSKYPDFPVVGVDWYDAYDYAAWVGRRLPTEAEWEKAAEGPLLRKYPWGDRWETAKANSVAGAEIRRQSGGAVAGGSPLMKVDSLPDSASPYGCLNMAGNVREWTGSRMAGSRTLYLVKGGSYADPPDDLAIANRSLVLMTTADMMTGFRCCINMKSSESAAQSKPGE